METNSVTNPMLTRKQAAEFLGIKEQTLNMWAHTHKYDLPYHKIGRAVRYKLEDLERFLERNQFGLGENHEAV